MAVDTGAIAVGHGLLERRRTPISTWKRARAEMRAMTCFSMPVTRSACSRGVVSFVLAMLASPAKVDTPSSIRPLIVVEIAPHLIRGSRGRSEHRHGPEPPSRRR